MAMAPSQILFFGDSITVGYTDSAGLGWPGRLCHGLVDDHTRSLTVYNLGVNGDTWRGAAVRWRSETEARSTDRDAGALVLAFGLNDAATIVGKGPQIGLQVSACCAKSVMLEASEFGPVLCIGPTPIDEAVNPMVEDEVAWDMRNDEIARYSETYAKTAAEAGVPYLNLMPRLKANTRYHNALTSGDGIHPTDDGYALIAELIGAWSAWQTLVNQAG